jgi:hypothetical protein
MWCTVHCNIACCCALTLKHTTHGPPHTAGPSATHCPPLSNHIHVSCTKRWAPPCVVCVPTLAPSSCWVVGCRRGAPPWSLPMGSPPGQAVGLWGRGSDPRVCGCVGVGLWQGHKWDCGRGRKGARGGLCLGPSRRTVPGGAAWRQHIALVLTCCPTWYPGRVGQQHTAGGCGWSPTHPGLRGARRMFRIAAV